MTLRDVRPLFAVLMLLAVILSGCVDDGDVDPSGDGDTNQGDSHGTGSEPGGQTDSGTVDGGSGNDPGSDPGNEPDGEPGPGTGAGGDGNATSNGTNGNQTSNGTVPEVIEWPNINQATVRPGVEVVVANALCTSNFLFRSKGNGTLYLGLAAHCVDDASPGATARIRNVNGGTGIDGTVAYSSWWSIGFEPDPSGVGDDVHPHDFALIEIADEDADKVHPAVLVYGGPTGLGDIESLSLGQRLLVYGNSNQYPRPSSLNPQEGIFLSASSTNVAGSPGTVVRTWMTAPVPGDSGSGLMTKDGKALGALSTISTGVAFPAAGVWWAYSSVPHALAHLEAEGWDLELQTWDQLDNGLLP